MNCYLTLYRTFPTFKNLKMEAFVNNVGKGENAVFYPAQNKFCFIIHIYFAVCKCFNSLTHNNNF